MGCLEEEEEEGREHVRRGVWLSTEEPANKARQMAKAKVSATVAAARDTVDGPNLVYPVLWHHID